MNLPKKATNADLLKLVQYIEDQGRLRGWSTNMKTIPQLSEDIMADVMTEYTGRKYVVEVASTKGWDIRCEETGEKIEVKTTVSKVRDIGALKNKGASDKIACIWFNLEDKSQIESVLVYPTNIVLENLKERKGKQPVFDKKGQLALKDYAIDLTDIFKKYV
jgi:hypothetical protein